MCVLRVCARWGRERGGGGVDTRVRAIALQTFTTWDAINI